jgi:hypothetical protein
MSCYYIVQSLYTYFNQPAVDWKRDYFLYRPNLYEPGDQEVICTTNTGTIGDATGIILDWLPVAKATKYIVQWCKNSSFTGPTLRASIVNAPTVQYALKIGDDIRHGDSMHWRVMAFNSDGGTSAKSEPRSFTYKCPGRKKGKGNEEDTTRDDMCEKFNVALEIKTPRIYLCCETNLAVLQCSYSCKTEEGEVVVTKDSIEWEILNVENQNGKIIKHETANERILGIETNCTGDNEFILKVCVNFTHVPTSTAFQCCTEVRVIVDCSYGYAVYKPWGKVYNTYIVSSNPTVFSYRPDPEFRSSRVGAITHPTGDFTPGIATKFMAGPVFVVDNVDRDITPRPASMIVDSSIPGGGCSPGIIQNQQTPSVNERITTNRWEARIPFPDIHGYDVKNIYSSDIVDGGCGPDNDKKVQLASGVGTPDFLENLLNNPGTWVSGDPLIKWQRIGGKISFFIDKSADGTTGCT